MAYTIQKSKEGRNQLVISGWEKGIAASPYLGTANIRGFNTSYYPSVAYTNYRRQAATVSFSTLSFWLAGTHSTDAGNNFGWTFSGTAPTPAMTNPVQKATSPTGLNYILDDSGQVFKQSAVNSTTFNYLANGNGRYTNGAKGLAYFNNYLVVFGNGFVEFCGDGTGDSTIISSNWNPVNYGAVMNSATFATNFAAFATRLTITSPANFFNRPRFQINDPIQFTTTGTLPAPLAVNTTYYILTIDTNYAYITVSTSVGGAAVTLTSNGTGTHTVTDYARQAPIGNSSSLVTNTAFSGTALTITSYVNPFGVTVNSNWQEATGVYNIVFPSGTKIPATFTNNSASITLAQPIVYYEPGNWQVQLLDTTVTHYRPYVSKVDGNLYFCNGRFLGRILAQNNNVQFFPTMALTYTVNYGATAILQQTDTVVDMVDLKSNLVIASTHNVYTWDYVSATVSSPSPIDEQIFRITNLLNNIYMLCGQKGNIYISNGYSAQLFYKIPDFIASVIDPVFAWGDFMVRRSKLFFQMLIKNTSGTNILAGIFSLVVSPTENDVTALALVMEEQNSYGLTPASGALSNGLLMDNSPSANGNDSYYSAWSNGAAVGGIDYNDTSLWQNWEPTIETELIPIGSILEKTTLGQIEFKLDRPMISGDQIRIYSRTSLSDSYTLMGTTTTAQLSDYYNSNIIQAQWMQFKIQTKCAASGSSFIPIREVRIQLQ